MDEYNQYQNYVKCLQLSLRHKFQIKKHTDVKIRNREIGSFFITPKIGIGLMNGIADEAGNVTLSSQGSTTRAMVAAMLERFCEKVIR